MKRFGSTLTMLLGASLGLAGCSSSIETPTDEPPAGSTSGSDDTTFDHDNDQISVWDVLKRQQDQGPPSVTAQMHSCPKVKITTLGNVLKSLGVAGITVPPPANPPALPANPAAKDLYNSGAAAMGAANYGARVRETTRLSTSQASKELDIFAAAADEIIKAFAAAPGPVRCQVNGTAPALFNGDTCNLDGITCLIGSPATAAHVDLCNKTITRTVDENKGTVDQGKHLAVAAMLAAAFTCE